MSEKRSTKGQGDEVEQFMASKGIIRNQKVNPEKVERSRELRKEMTAAEKVFWNIVRGRKFHGLKFRRQQVIDGFIIDFYCDSLALCIEIDGSIHETGERSDYDRERDKVLTERGLKIVRFTNDDVLYTSDIVFKKLLEIFNETMVE